MRDDRVVDSKIMMASAVFLHLYIEQDAVLGEIISRQQPRQAADILCLHISRKAESADIDSDQRCVGLCRVLCRVDDRAVAADGNGDVTV